MIWALGQLELATLPYDAWEAVEGVQGCIGCPSAIPARRYLWSQMWLAGFLTSLRYYAGGLVGAGSLAYSLR